MSQRIALTNSDGTVVNVARFPDEWDGTEWIGHTAHRLASGERVQPGDVRTSDGWERPAIIPGADVEGLLAALREQLGKQAVRTIGRQYPDAVIALQTGGWDVVREAIDDANADGVLTDAQHQAVLDLAAQHNVPL